MTHSRLSLIGALALAPTCLWHTALAQTSSADQPPETRADQPLEARPTEVSAPPAKEAQPDEAEELEHVPDTTLSRFRTPFEVLTESAIGRTSRRVRFDWRRGTLQLGATGGLPAELNNFDSLRAGGFVRFPTSDLLLELGIYHVWVWGSPSTERLALTPYRQPGRPDRFELGFSLSYPIAEGVVTAFPRFIPVTELVLNAQAQFRYLLYPSGFSDLGFKDTLKAIVSGSLSGAELENLEDERLPGMEIDPGRYGLLVGLGNDIYFQSGFFFSYEFLVAVPLLQFMTETELGFCFDLDLSMGVAF